MNNNLTKFTVTIIAILLFWTVFVYYPAQSKLSEISKDKQELSAQLADFRKTVSQLPEFINTFQNLESIRKTLNEKLYTKQDVLRLFDRLDSLAVSYNLHLYEITPPVSELLYLNKIVSDSTKPLHLNITLKLRGDYVNFGKFSEILEKEKYFQKLNHCQIIGSRREYFKLNHLLGFKAILGSDVDRS